MGWGREHASCVASDAEGHCKHQKAEPSTKDNGFADQQEPSGCCSVVLLALRPVLRVQRELIAGGGPEHHELDNVRYVHIYAAWHKAS